MFYWFAHGLFVVLSKLMFPITVKGIRYLPRRRGFILASNHLSNFDPMILGIASGKRLCYVAKSSLFKNKFFSIILSMVGAFPIRRSTSDVRAIKEALKRLNMGYGTVIFPEGTRKIATGKKKVQAGIGFLAAKSELPVVPAYIYGSDTLLPPGAKWLRYSRITVAFGKPIKFLTKQSSERIAQDIMEEIDALAAHTRV